MVDEWKLVRRQLVIEEHLILFFEENRIRAHGDGGREGGGEPMGRGVISSA